MKISTEIMSFKLRCFDNTDKYVAHIYCDGGYATLYVGKQPMYIRAKENSIPIHNKEVWANLISFISDDSKLLLTCSTKYSNDIIFNKIINNEDIILETNGNIEQYGDTYNFSVSILKNEICYIIKLIETLIDKKNEFERN